MINRTIPWNQQGRPQRFATSKGLRRGMAGENVGARLQAERLCHVLEDPRGALPARHMVDVDCRHKYRIIRAEHGLRMAVEIADLRPPSPRPEFPWRSRAMLGTFTTAAACLLGASLCVLLAVSPPGAIALGAVGGALLAAWAVTALYHLFKARGPAQRRRDYREDLLRQLELLERRVKEVRP